jgi:hypothetical protein
VRGFSEGKSDVTKMYYSLVLALSTAFFVYGVAHQRSIISSPIDSISRLSVIPKYFSQVGIKTQ